ncbi:MAG: hypothetical protein H7306_14980 [Bacteriovorax sp.]|nr:hypothetical protein [Rhizobacter sp.]
MNAVLSLHTFVSRRCKAVAMPLICLVLAACGGSANAPPPPETGRVPPTITQQPADLSVTAGQGASFTVAATGTAPLSYQWQRDGVNVSGATGTTYALETTVIGDSAAMFRAVVTNEAGTATSNAATLTVVASAPVLTITRQPADTSVVAGTQATFSVAGTCSSGTLSVQWQRSSGSGGGLTWADIVTATATDYSLATVIGDSGTQFRANLACSGQSPSASSVAVLTVTAPAAITLGALTITGRRASAPIGFPTAIDRAADGSYLFYGGTYIWRLATDLSSIANVAGNGSFGTIDGVGPAASFNDVRGMTHDAAGNLWITDNSRIRRVAPDGTTVTIAGPASFSGLAGIAIGPDGDLYVSDQNNSRVLRVTTAGVVTTYATGLLAPFGIAVAANNDVYVAEAQGNRVSRIVRSGNLAGATQVVAGDGTANLTNPADGPGVTASLPGPSAMFLRGTTLYVRDNAGLMRTVDITTGVVGTLTGSRTLGPGLADGPAGQAQLQTSAITGIADAPSGGLLVAEPSLLRTIDAAGKVTTIANGIQVQTTLVPSAPTSTGVLAQLPFEFRFAGATSIAVDAQGRIVVSEAGTSTVRRIDTAGNVTLLGGLAYRPSTSTNALNAVSVDGVGSAGLIGNSGAVAIAPNGNIYVPSYAAVKRIDAAGMVLTVAGSNDVFGQGSVDGPPATARFNSIFGLAVAPTTSGLLNSGDVLVSDTNNAIRRIDAATGTVTTFSGVMLQSGSVDGAAGTARYSAPSGLAFAPDGTLYVNDNGNLRRIAADGSVVTTTVTGMVSFVFDPAGALYVLKASGLYAVSTGGAETLLMPVGSGVVYGSTAPTLGTGDGALAMLGPKQILIVSGRSLNVVSLP